ncbi:MAG: hypothetical protein WBD40_08530 [Tepidisphaeraceae bacterium]
MNLSSTFMIIVGQLATSLPMLLVYIGGIVWALLCWRRAPRAAGLATAGLALMLITHVGSAALQGYFISNRGAAPASNLAQAMMVVGFASTLLRALGMGLLVAAVFANRPRIESAFPIEPAQPPLAGLAPGAPPRF